MFKIGSQLFTAAGPQAVREVAAGQASRLTHDVNARLMLGKAVPISPNELTLSLTMVVGGGVAPESLGRQVLGWVEEVREIVKTLPGQEGRDQLRVSS